MFLYLESFHFKSQAFHTVCVIEGRRASLSTEPFRIHPPQCLRDLRERGEVEVESFIQRPQFQPFAFGIAVKDIVGSLPAKFSNRRPFTREIWKRTAVQS